MQFMTFCDKMQQKGYNFCIREWNMLIILS